MSQRRVGGAIKKGRGAKIALREEEVEEKEVDKDVEQTKKPKKPAKTKPIAKKRGKATVKEAIFFDNNDFKQNSIQDKARLLRGQEKIIKDESKEIRHTKYSSFIGGQEIDLSKIQVKAGLSQQKKANKAPKISLSKQNCLTIQTMKGSYYGQYYLDYELNPSKKYTLKFTIASFSNFFFVGLMRKDLISESYLHTGTSGLFFKRFYFFSPAQDCSKVLKGSLFGDIVRPGDSFEMRFCIQDQILEFSTLPGHENVVSKHDHAQFDTSPDVQYVITLNPYNVLGLSFDSLEENFFLPSYC